MIPVNGGNPIPLTQAGTRERHASISPDDQAVVFVRYEDAGRVSVLDLESGELDEPLNVNVPARNPVFSPDGEYLLFQAAVEGRWQIWSGCISGKDEIHPVLLLGETWSFQPTVLPDGSILHLRAERRPITIHGAIEWPQTLWLSSADGGRHRALEAAGNRVHRLSPGGFFVDRWLVTTIDEHGQKEKILLLRDGEAPEIVWEDSDDRYMTAFDWGPHDDEILLAVNPEGGDRCCRICAMDLETRELQPMVDLIEVLGTSTQVYAIAMAPDRTRIAILAYVTQGDSEMVRELLVYEPPSLNCVHVFESGESPASLRWSPDGRRVTFHLADERSDLYIWEAPGRGGV